MWLSRPSGRLLIPNDMTDQELLALAKKHCRIDADYTDDDDYIMQLIAVAKEATAWQIDALPEPEPEPNASRAVGDDPEPTPEPPAYEPAPSELQALLLLIGQMYANREITGDKDKLLPKSYDYLLSIKRRYTIA